MNKYLPDRNSSLDQLREFADVEWLVTDLDGTLVKNQQLLYQFRETRMRVNDSKLKSTIATGRTFFASRPIVEQMKIKRGTPLLLYNGALVITYLDNRILEQKTIPIHVLRDLCGLLDLEHQYLLAYYTFKFQNYLIETVHGFGLTASIRDVNGLEIEWHPNYDIETRFDVDDASLCNKGLFMIGNGTTLYKQKQEPQSILIEKKVITDRIEVIEEYLRNNPLISYTSSGSGFIEICAKGVTKSSIYKYIHPSKGKKIVAIGDNDNDVDLLRCADIGVAVANGSSDVKKVAKYLCREKGAAGVLELIMAIKNADRYWEG